MPSRVYKISSLIIRVNFSLNETGFKPVPIELKVRVSDLRKAGRVCRQFAGSHKDTDFADLFVTECGATFCSIDTSTEVPIHGLRVLIFLTIHAGTAPTIDTESPGFKDSHFEDGFS
jgi:hypothetical protein